MRRALILVAALSFAAPTLAAEVDPAPFRPYASGLIDRLALGTERLAATVAAGDLAGAREAWVAARVEAQDPALHRRIVERMVDLGAALAVPSIADLDQSRVMARSERLAGDFQDAALVLGLEEPALGG